MQMMLRDRDYPELLEELKGRKVLIWTCNTCARLCDVGGRENAEALAGRLMEDGVEVVGISSTGASCILPVRLEEDGRRNDFAPALRRQADKESVLYK